MIFMLKIRKRRRTENKSLDYVTQVIRRRPTIQTQTI